VAQRRETTVDADRPRERRTREFGVDVRAFIVEHYVIYRRHDSNALIARALLDALTFPQLTLDQMLRAPRG
jgi:hypothetical protein